MVRADVPFFQPQTPRRCLVPAGATPSSSSSSSSSSSTPGADPTSTGDWWDCPFDALGVSPGASSADVRSAFRRLAKLHHPDVSPDPSSAHRRFLRLAEAYAAITGRGASARHGGARRGGASTRAAGGGEQGGSGRRRRGGGHAAAAAPGTAGAGWDFHDWFWGFAAARGRGVRCAAGGDGAAPSSPSAAAGPPPPTPAAHSELKAQLAGMRAAAAARGAARAGKEGTAGTAAGPVASPPPGPRPHTAPPPMAGPAEGIGLQLTGLKRRSALRKKGSPRGVGGEEASREG